MRRLTLTLALFGFLALSAFAVIGTASAHENCIHTTEHGWQLTGCVSDDGSVVWTAVDPSDKFYRWVNGKWQEQERPSVPEPIVLSPIRSDAPATLGLPAFGKRGSGRIEYAHHVEPSRDAVVSEVAVLGASNNRHFPLGLLRISCLHPGTFMSVTVDAYLSILGRKYRAWLDSVGDTQVSLSTRPHRWRTIEGLDTRDQEVAVSSSVGENTRWVTLYNRAQDFFRELMKHDHLAVRLPGIDGPIIVTFDLDGVFDTPVQHLLERCLGE